LDTTDIIGLLIRIGTTISEPSSEVAAPAGLLAKQDCLDGYFLHRPSSFLLLDRFSLFVVCRVAGKSLVCGGEYKPVSVARLQGHGV